MNILEKVQRFYHAYKGEKGVIGKTEKGKDVYFFKVEKTPYPVIIAQYGMHAREYITCDLALKHIKYFSRCGKVGTVYFIPAVNPDGIEICVNGNPLKKSNALGVDLNLNFPARWGTGDGNSKILGQENFIGARPLCAKESLALFCFTLAVKPDKTVSFHSKGEEIYYYFDQEDGVRDFVLAKKLQSATGYAVKLTSNSAGGYKDWCISRLKIPSFTIEVGNDNLSHPIDLKYSGRIFKKCKNVINVLTEN